MARIVETALSYTVELTQYSGLLVSDIDRNPTAAVILLPDWKGQSGLARDHARYLVQHGCIVAIAWATAWAA